MYRQNKGISQGSCVSSHFCHMYLSHMEAQHLRIHHQDTLIRMVDDYLFITDSQPRANSFLSFFLNESIASQKYNIRSNIKKTLINFDYGEVKSTPIISWCGYLLNTNNLEITSDFSSYNYPFKHAITSFMPKNPGRYIIKRLKFALKSKVTPIFFDTTINSYHTIFYNIYKLYLISAFRFRRLVCGLLMHNSIANNPRFFYNIIQRLSHFVGSCFYTDRKLRTEYNSVVEYLCLTAFDTKLSCHQGHFKPLLMLVRSRRNYLFHNNQKNLEEIEIDLFPIEFRLIVD